MRAPGPRDWRRATSTRRWSEERSLLITWLNRGTLHLARSEDYPWLHALTTPPLMTSSVYRLAREGLTEAGGRAGGEGRSSGRWSREGR